MLQTYQVKQSESVIIY